MDKRMRTVVILATAAAVVVSAPLRAQLLPVDPLGTVGRAGRTLGETVRDTTSQVTDPLGEAVHDARSMARERLRRIGGFVSGHGDRVEWDDDHQPAVRGEVLLVSPDPAALETARGKGYTVLEQAEIEALGLAYARLGTPEGMSLAKAVQELRKALPGREISADQLHFPSGAASQPGGAGTPETLPHGGTVGVIDGGIASSSRLAAQRGFASGAPKASDHAGAIASLLAGAGTTKIYGADVYGSDPAGGSALAIARALGWMQGQGVPVVSISLVGPSNPLLARAVAGAQGKGMVIVAAVGNDGAAAPPAFPASYPGVVAMTGVDRAGRVLIEAGQAAHLDYAAPGADISARIPGRGRVSLRGTSYAVPLAAARIAAWHTRLGSGANALKAVDSEAIKGTRRTGRGVLCSTCRSGL
jgi:hypothetical protein